MGPSDTSKTIGWSWHWEPYFLEQGFSVQMALASAKGTGSSMGEDHQKYLRHGG
ncbi:hypothetical protein Syun_027551 [Stephania yunnanensis]|uniref:Uncharacterized protein n=1 Tax=Stephania yunnanensis TaxID=152371 RepID=A0AAP0HRD0_9MAGN